MKTGFSLFSIFLLGSLTTNAQATLEADIKPGTSSSFPKNKTIYKGRLYYESLGATTSWGLRSIQGTNESMVYDYPITGVVVAPPFLINYDSKLFFLAHDTNTVNFGPNTLSLWSYNGTTAAIEATNVVLNGKQGTVSTGPVVYNGKLYFKGFDITNNGRELWSFDGSIAALVGNIRSNSGHSDPYNLAVYDNKLFFSAHGDHGGVELWSYDSVADTLIQEADIAASGSSSPHSSIVYDGKLFFAANDGINGYELWSFDGTVATLEADINPGAGYSSPGSLIIYKNKLFFSANNGVNGIELWSYDGTTAIMEADMQAGAANSLPRDLIIYSNKLFFSADDPTTGVELWSFDGDTAMIEAEIRPFAGSSAPKQMAVFENKLFFTAEDNAHGKELWSFYDISLGINDPTPQSEISFFPNPTNESITINLGVQMENLTVNVYNFMGALVQSKVMGTVTAFNYQLPKNAGVYLIQLVDIDSSELKIIKVIKE